MNLNKVFLIGNLTRQPEIRYTQSGMAVTTLGLAVNNKFKRGDEWVDEVDFIDVTVWGKSAENCTEYLSKGSPVMVEGRLKYHTWDSAKDGSKRSKVDVTATNVQFLSGKVEKDESNEPPVSDDSAPF